MPFVFEPGGIQHRTLGVGDRGEGEQAERHPEQPEAAHLTRTDSILDRHLGALPFTALRETPRRRVSETLCVRTVRNSWATIEPDRREPLEVVTAFERRRVTFETTLRFAIGS